MMGNILLLDTETVNTKSSGFSIYGNNVFDIGFLIIDGEDYNIIAKYNNLIEEIYDDKELMKNYVFGEEKIKWYDYKTSGLYINPIADVNQTINEMIKYYNVDAIAAYNINFDIGAIKHTWEKYNLKSFISDKMKIIDIYHIACQMLHGNDNYIIACVENGKISEKGNVNSNAEAVYCFIKNNFNFEEKHTALADCEIEYEIFMWCLEESKRQNKIFKSEPNPAAWRLVQKKKK